MKIKIGGLTDKSSCTDAELCNLTFVTSQPNLDKVLDFTANMFKGSPLRLGKAGRIPFLSTIVPLHSCIYIEILVPESLHSNLQERPTIEGDLDTVSTLVEVALKVGDIRKIENNFGKVSFERQVKYSDGRLWRRCELPSSSARIKYVEWLTNFPHSRFEKHAQEQSDLDRILNKETISDWVTEQTDIYTILNHIYELLTANRNHKET